jgi:hypothetical protein
MVVFALSCMLSSVILYASQFMTCSFIIGSWHSYFSFANISIPLFVSHCNIVYALFYYLAKALFAKNGFWFIAKKASLLVSGVAYKRHSPLFSFVVPALCMALFMTHAVGSHVFWYSFFWFIPMILHVFVKDNIFASALQSTFLAHAIGSVVWLYIYGLEAQYFVVAAPFVLFERLAFAGGIVCADYAITFVKNKLVSTWNLYVGALI